MSITLFGQLFTQQADARVYSFNFQQQRWNVKKLHADFMFRSKAGFDNCVGCIDGMLLWIEKTFPKE